MKTLLKHSALVSLQSLILALTTYILVPADPLQQHAARARLLLAPAAHPRRLPRLAHHQRCILQENPWFVNTIIVDPELFTCCEKDVVQTSGRS